MSEHTKKRPSWLSGEDSPTEEPAFRVPGRKGPLAEPDTNDQQSARGASADGPHAAAARDDAVTRVSVPGAKTAGAAPRDTMGRVRANPGPVAMALVAVFALGLVSYFLFFRGGEEQPASTEGGGMQQSAGDPFAGGTVRDSGILFDALQEEGGEAKLDGAGLNWSGTVTEKEGEAGETVTLEGPTAAQLERGFDLGSSSVETGVYAVAQDSGEVLHVTTHTFLPEEGTEAQELTLGTVYSVEEGGLEGYAYYLDRRENGSNTVTRTYVRPGAEGYSVSYEAEPGAFVRLLIGWRGFGDDAGGAGGGG